MSDTGRFDTLDIVCGSSNPNVAQVFFRLAKGFETSGGVMRGMVRGPLSLLTHTLPTQVAVQDMGADPRPLARVVLVDPCFWAPGKPYRYDLQLDWVVDGRVVDRAERTFGIRASGVLGSALRLNFAPWILRGVVMAPERSRSPSDWRQSGWAQVWSHPLEDVCREASEEGIPIVAGLSGNLPSLYSQLRRLSRWPSVVLAVVQSDDSPDESLRSVAPNVMLGQTLTKDGPLELAPWAHIGLCDADTLRRAAPLRTHSFPLILTAASGALAKLGDVESAIMQLQQTADPEQRCAGYIV